MGIFDEGCMGMYNAIIDDELLNPTGVYKERLSQSALVAEMRTVSEGEARSSYQWLLDRGMKFQLGDDEQSELTEKQVLEQLKMYKEKHIFFLILQTWNYLHTVPFQGVHHTMYYMYM